jgi:hypothetical protein
MKIKKPYSGKVKFVLYCLLKEDNSFASSSISPLIQRDNFVSSIPVLNATAR